MSGLLSYQKVCESLFLSAGQYIILDFGTELYRPVAMGTNFAQNQNQSQN